MESPTSKNTTAFLKQDQINQNLASCPDFNSMDPLVKIIFGEGDSPNWQSWPMELATFENARPLIMCLDGYAAAQHLEQQRTGQVVESFQAAANIAHRLGETYAETGRWIGSALELWITGFFQIRTERFTCSFLPIQKPDGSWDTVGADNPDTTAEDALTRTLRQMLIAAPI